MRRTAVWAVVLGLLASAAISVSAQKVKDPMNQLDDVVFGKPELRTVAQHEELSQVRSLAPPPTLSAFDAFLAKEGGGQWLMIFDRVTGRPALMEGLGVPWIPGTANALTGYDIGLDALAVPNEQVPLKVVAGKALDLIRAYPDLFGVDPRDLQINEIASGPVLNYLYFVDFRWTYYGIPVEGAHVVFRLNHGNLVQMGQENVNPSAVRALDPTPALTRETAWDILASYLGGLSPKDQTLEKGRLLVLPVSTPETLSGVSVLPGSGVRYRLVYELSFRRPGVIGTWEARVDAHTGELLSFLDANRYGKVHGGVYPTDQPATEIDRPFPYADTGLAAPNNYADSGGLFPGNTATSTLTGKYVDIVDTCGAISLSTTTGDLNFGTSTATDCNTPGFGGAGNTRASRTQYYHVTMVKIKALTYMPTNTWLQGVVTDNVNLNQTCNAYWNGTSLNFFNKGAGQCWNTGELPGVSLHEWGHGMDSNDGMAPADKGTGETYGDFTGSLQTHGSCAGGGFFFTMNRGCGTSTVGFNCSGYGDCCSNCSGIRELDYAKHASNLPYFAEDLTSNVCAGCTTYACTTSATYAGPCGYEGHCESLISSQAMWDLPARDLVTWGLDIDTAWQTMDRYWYASRGTSGGVYACPTLTTTNGCGAANYFSTFRVVDDCDGNLANGTPHASAIYNAFNRHKIACTSVVNTDQTGCCPVFSPNTPVLSGTAGSNSAVLSWGAVTNATRYFVYRNESGCSAGYTRVATVTAPTLNYTDTTVVNGVTYYYRIQAASASDACTTAMSNCVTITPQPCAGAVTLDRALYSCSDTVNVTVLDSTVVTPVTVKFWSSVDATQKTLTLTNNPVGSATYTGSFTTTSGPAGATQCQVADGATITVQYTDPDYCGTPNQVVTTTATADCAGPVITNVAVSNITDSTADVTWTTNEAANSRVTYGTSIPPGTNKDDLANYVTSHTMTLTGLTGCTTYRFSVTSADTATNSTTNNNGGAYFSFTTLGRYFAFGPDNVEGGAGTWTASGTAGSVWHIDTCRANSPTRAWKAGASDAPTCSAQYGNTVTTDLTSAAISLGAAGHGLHLRYSEYYATESGYDWCVPQISTNGGASWTDLMTHYAGSSGAWGQRDLDLASYSGSILIRFHFTTDGSVTAEGWYVDDIEISKPAGCTPTLSRQSHTYTEACNGTGTGGGNTYIDPGEDVTVVMTLVNTGMQAATGVSATLSCSTPGITVTTPSATFPNIAANGGTGASNAPHFIYRVGTSVTCGTVLNFTLHAVSTENPAGTDSTFTMTVGQVIPGGGTLFTEAFDAVTPPALPAGWATAQVSGTAGAWATNAGTRYPAGGGAHSAPNVAYFNSFTSTSGNSTRLYRNAAGFAIPAGATSATLSFWMYHDPGYSGSNDTIQPQVSTNAGGTWTNVGTAISRYAATAAWTQHTVSLNAYIGQADVRLAFVGTSAYGNDCHIDDVQVTYTATGGCNVSACTPGALAPPEVAPGTTPATSQGWTNKTTHTWPAEAQATGYKVYRGLQADLPALLTAAQDSCLKYTGAATSCTVNEDPAGVAGRFYWYLVTGTNTGGEGTAGNATAGPRVVNSGGTCP